MMIRINDNLYPINHIKNIKIDEEKMILTVYFNSGTGLYPVVEEYDSKKKLDERIRELSGSKRPNRLLG